MKRGECSECNETKEVSEYTPYWTAWGGNCCSLNWWKHTDGIHLCDECCSAAWTRCEDCGELLELDHAGYGYEQEDDTLWDSLCIECAEKRGYRIFSSVRMPDWLPQAAGE